MVVFEPAELAWAWAGSRTCANRQQHLQVDQQQPNLCKKRSAPTLPGHKEHANSPTDMFPFLRGDAHAQKCAVLSINSGHAVALPAAPHFIVVLRWKDSACWTPATLLSVRISAFFFILFSPRESKCRNCERVRGEEGCGCAMRDRCWPPPRRPLLSASASSCADTAAPPCPVRLPAPSAARLFGVGSSLAGQVARVGLGVAERQAWPLWLSSSGERSSKDTGAHPARALAVLFVVFETGFQEERGFIPPLRCSGAFFFLNLPLL